MNTAALITAVVSLPVEDRALVVESLLKSLNQPESNNDIQWGALAKKRLEDMQSGEVEVLDGEQVFSKIWQRFKK